MATPDYEKPLQDDCLKITVPNAELECERAYYSARKAMASNQDKDDDGELYYQGKISDRAFAASLDNVTLNAKVCTYEGDPPSALSGKVISYECRQNPAATAYGKFKRTSQHHATCGILTEEVYCVIEQPSVFIPSKKK